MIKEFYVQSESFPLYEAFRKEVEKIGFKQAYWFSTFTEKDTEKNNCIYFADDFEGDEIPNAFAFSNKTSDVQGFRLESEWSEALEFAKDNFSLPKDKAKEPELSMHAIKFGELIAMAANKYGVKPEQIYVMA